jgi:excisionase family DNA binding protein
MESAEKLLLRVAEAAELIGVSRSKMYELISSGAVPSVRLEEGRIVRVPLAALKKIAETLPSDARMAR